MSVVAEVAAADPPRRSLTPRQLRRTAPPLLPLKPGWPLRVLLLGFPVLWALGLSGFAASLLAVPMALELRRRRPLKLPRGFTLWVLFLLCSFAGFLVLGVNPPGTVVSGTGARLFGFGMRELSYVTVTIVLLYVGNLTEKELPQRQLVKWMGTFFVIATLGGLLGLVMPDFQFTSPFELMLPHSIRSNIYVAHLVHPAAAQVQDLFGDQTPRPSAPFDYTNTWGFHMSLLAVWFVVDWFCGTGTPRRIVGALILAVGGVTIAMSLNRAAWIGVVISVVYLAVRLAARGRLLPLAGLGLGVLVAGAVLLASPLHQTFDQRLDNGQSNDIRALTSQRAIDLAEQSPIIGYGSSRAALGSGSTITVGRSASCPQCGNPVIGSNGYVFMLLVSTGVVGTGLFLGFGLARVRRTARDPSPLAMAGTLVILLTGFYGFFYDVASWMAIPFISLGVLWRHDQLRSDQRAREKEGVGHALT